MLGRHAIALRAALRKRGPFAADVMPAFLQAGDGGVRELELYATLRRI